jgi:hypothetical protein
VVVKAIQRWRDIAASRDLRALNALDCNHVVVAMGNRDEHGPTIVALLEDGLLAGRRIEAEVVEGRPPKTLDVAADDGSTCRYGLAEWAQTGPSAAYTFLYVV